MQLSLEAVADSFKQWNPSLGQVFTDHYGFSIATPLQDPKRPWLIPPFVMGAGFDGHRGYYVLRPDLDAFLHHHQNIPVGLHGAAHQLAVMKAASKTVDLYQMVDRNVITDTEILHRLLVLATTGETAKEEAEHDHVYCVNHYLGINLPKASAPDGRVVNDNYGQWLNREFHEIQPIYLKQLAKTAITTAMMLAVLPDQLKEVLNQIGPHAFGYVSHEWLQQQISRWGLQTHHIQLRASIALLDMTHNGLHLDVKRLHAVQLLLNKRVETLQKNLRQTGYMPEGNQASKSLEGILKRLEREYQVQFPRRTGDQYASSHDALEEFAERIPFIKDLLEYRETQSLLGNLSNKIEKTVLHPSYNVLVKTGRTSSYGELNAQGISRDPDVRSCFIPSPGHVFLDFDYNTVELSTLSQACMSQFSMASRMANAINNGHDLHRFVAAQILKIPEESVTSEQREKAKVFNFGIPGGMGPATLLQKARSSFGSDLTEHDIKTWSDGLFELFPEIGQYLHHEAVNVGVEIVKMFELDLVKVSSMFGFDGTINLNSNEIAGKTFLKILREPEPKTRNGVPYNKELLNYVWHKLESKRRLLSLQAQQLLDRRQASLFLHQEVKSLVDRAGVLTLTGRLRAKADFMAQHNTIFQGLAADGAKLALWQLWKSNYRVVNFIHDQFLIEVPRSGDYQDVIQNIETILQNAMREVVPDVRVTVKYTIREKHWG